MAPTANAPAAQASASPKRRGKRSPVVVPTDRHWLYQEAVQSPEVHVAFFDRVYRRRNGRLPRLLKEDFCGTALLCAQWVKTRRDNAAVGVDLDADTLAWGRRHNVAPLEPEARTRVQLVRDDVRRVTRPRVDVVAALNFSYFEFKTRDALREYFAVARRSLRPGGVLVLDMYGGWEAQMGTTDKTRNRGFTYIWEQASYDPITHLTRFFIHFKHYASGRTIKRAFEYNWRQWTIPEVRELLSEAGFTGVDVYWEGFEKDTGEGNGIFTLARRAENCPGWIALLVASR